MLTGSCHCGSLQLSFANTLDPAQLPLRACACSFCRRHGARTTSDPNGHVEITVRDKGYLSRYQFALLTAEFLVCKRCGVYVAAVMTGENDELYATVNTNALDARGQFTQNPVTVNYEGEDAASRVARRRVSWTPATIVWVRA